MLILGIICGNLFNFMKCEQNQIQETKVDTKCENKQDVRTKIENRPTLMGGDMLGGSWRKF